MQVDPRVDHLHRLVGRALLVGLLQERGERGAHRLAIGAIEALVVALAGALIGGLVVVGLLLGGFELRERRVNRGAYSFVESIGKRIRCHGPTLTRSRPFRSGFRLPRDLSAAAGLRQWKEARLRCMIHQRNPDARPLGGAESTWVPMGTQPAARGSSSTRTS